MGLGDLLKRAFGAVGEFDRRAVYGPDYKERGAALASLNDLNIKAKLLENQDKFEQIQKMRQELAQRDLGQQQTNFTNAATIGANMEPVSSGIMGPPNDANPNDMAGRATEPPLPSFIKSQIKPEDMGPLTNVIQEQRRKRKKLEFQNDQLFNEKVNDAQLKDANIGSQMSLREAQAWRALHPTAGGADFANVNGGVGESGGNFGSLVFNKRTGQMEFRPVEGFTPNSAKPNQGTRDALFGVAQSYDNLGEVEKAVKHATDILGPVSGRVALGEKKWLGGEGLTSDQVTALSALDRATMMAAFQNGGKQLTGVELDAFMRQYPQPTDNLQVLLTKASFLRKMLKQEAVKRKASLTGPEAASIPDWNAMGSVFGGEGGGATGKKIIKFDSQGNIIP